jgi:hypothetical protein
MHYSFPFSFGTNPSGEHIKGGLPSTGITRPSSRSPRSIVVIFEASRRAIERFFKMWWTCCPLKPILHLYIIIPSINFESSPRYLSRRVAHESRTKGDGDLISRGSISSNTSNSSI